MDRRTDGWTDGWTDGRTEGQAGRQADIIINAIHTNLVVLETFQYLVHYVYYVT